MWGILLLSEHQFRLRRRRNAGRDLEFKRKTVVRSSKKKIFDLCPIAHKIFECSRPKISASKNAINIFQGF